MRVARAINRSMRLVAGAIIVSGLGLAPGSAAVAAPEHQQIRLGHVEGNLHPGDIPFFSFDGWGCSEAIDVTFLSLNFRPGCGGALGSPSQLLQLRIPPTTAPGTYPMHASSADGRSADYWVTISPFNPSALASSYYISTNEILSLEARDFMYGEEVRLFVNGTATLTKGTAFSRGGRYFTTSAKVTLRYPIPGNLAGKTVTLDLVGNQGHSTRLTVSIATQ